MNARISFMSLFGIIALVAFLSSAGYPQERATDNVDGTQLYAANSMSRTVENDDSLEIRAEIDALQKEVDDLKAKAANMPDGDDKDAILLEVSEKESQIIELQQRLQGESPKEDEWDFEGFGEDDDAWEKTEDDSEFDEWADLEGEFFEKYPAVFTWPFPMDTEFSKTFLRYNRVEGFYLGLAHDKRLNWHSKKQVVTTFSLGYGFASKKGRYSAGLYLPFYFEDQIIEIGGEGHLLTDSKDQWMIDRDENSLMAFFAKEDFMDYFQRGGYSVSGSWYYRTSDEQNLRFSARYIHDTYKEMGKETNWSLFGGDKQFRENPIMNSYAGTSPIAGNINSLMFAAGWSTTAADTRDHGWRVNLSYESAGGFLDGDYEFDQLIFDARRYQPLGEHINLNARFRVGGSDGMLPFQRTFDMGGIGTLPGYRFKMFTGNQMGLLNTEIILKSSIADLGDGWFKRIMESFNVILFYDVGTVVQTFPEGDFVDEANNAIDVPTSESIFEGIGELSSQRWLSSAGVAVGSRDGSYRIGVAWPLTGETKDATFVIRLAAPF